MSPTPPRGTVLIDLARQYGGAETRVVQLLRTLPDSVALCLHGGGLHRRCCDEGLATVTLRAGRADPALVVRMTRLLRARRPAVVDAHGVAAQCWGLPAARLAGVPVRIATVHSEYRAEQAVGSLRGRGYEAVLRTTRATATGWIAVSDRISDDLRRLGLPAARISTVRSGVEVDAAPPTGTERRAGRAALGFGDDDLVVAIVGRLHPGKGHRVALTALARIVGDAPQLRLLLVGDGPHRARLRSDVADLGLADHVAFTGYRTDVPALLRLADAFCLPTDRSEGLPYAVLEAAAAGLPVVATRVGGVADLFADGHTALLVPPADAAALAAALGRLRDAELRMDLGAAARTLATERLSVATMASATAAAHGTAPQAPGGVADDARRGVPLRRRIKRTARTAVVATAGSAPAAAAIDLVDRVARSSPAALPVLMYHRVAPVDGDHGFDPVLLSATPAAFAEQLDRLTRSSHLLTLDEVLQVRRGGRPLPERAVLLTFDDAYAGFLRWAWPVLRAYGAPCVVFAPTAYPGTERQFWWEDLYRALQLTDRPRLDTAAGTVPLRTAAERSVACHRLSDWIKATAHAEAMRHLHGWLDELGRPAPVRTTMTWDELRELTAAGVDVAPHSRTHAMLDRLPPSRLAEEVRGAIADVRDHLGRCPPAFCYPAGQRSAAVRDELRRAGVEMAFSTDHGINRASGLDWLGLQRIDVSAAMPAALVQLTLQPWAEPLAARLA